MKQGYKQTEIGVIPEDWNISSLKDISDGRFTYGVNAPAVPYAPPLPNYIRITDISDDGYFIKENRTSVECQDSEVYTLKENDIVFARTGASTGKTYLYKKSDGTLVYAGFLIKTSIQSEKANSKYVFYCLHTQRYWDWVAVTSMRSGQPGINGNEYASFVIPYPPLSEQERIAEALSDVDNLIISLEKLIAKKKAIKQGAMQDLLTGKKRLPGFSGEWLEKKVEDIITRFATGLNPRQNFKLNNGGTNYYVTIKDFREGKLFLDDDCDRIDDVALKRINERSDLQKDDLLFSSIGRIGDAYLITETPKNWNINESVFALRPNQQVICTLMLYYLLTSEEVKNKLLDNTTGSTLKSIKLGHLKEIPCRFPKDINEQTAIASILSDMDSEIEALEEKLEKIRQVKQGMMQELLTGKIRLV